MDVTNFQPVEPTVHRRTGLGPGTGLRRGARALLTAAVACAAVPAALLHTVPAAHAATPTPAAHHALGALTPKVKVSASSPSGFAAAVLPSSVDLRAWAVPVGDQGAVGSCVTWAIDYAMLGWYSRHDGKAGQPFAPMYTYSQINGGVDNGSYAADAMNVAKSQGSDTRAHYQPQGDFDWWDQPTAAERSNAASYKISAFTALFSGATGQGLAAISKVEAALANGHPVAIGMNVRAGLLNLSNDPAAVDNDTTPPVLGGHEVLAVGYDSAGLIFQNSWGTNWGNAGFGRLSWQVVATDVTDAYTIEGFASATADKTAPAVIAPAQKIAPGSQIGSTVSVTESWSATDPSGISAYALYVSVDGGAWASVSLRTPTTTSLTFALTPSHSYRFAAAARDGAGNWSGYAYGPTYVDRVQDDASAAIAYHGQWSRMAWSPAYGGYQVASVTAGAYARFSFTGRSVAWVAPTSTVGGQANIYVDGAYVKTVNLNAATTTARKAVFTKEWTSSAAHTIDVQVVGTAGHPQVDIDAFVALG